MKIKKYYKNIFNYRISIVKTPDKIYHRFFIFFESITFLWIKALKPKEITKLNTSEIIAIYNGPKGVL
ncbi:MAG TPA: hypothetical protein VN703_03535, partial [Candidatus Sulfopaludibacter sp.]|nr:hypothetical protein [Candidatus Sulfopaludibacter sp.]